MAKSHRKVPRDRLLASVVLKKRKAEATGPDLYFIFDPWPRVCSLRTIAKSRCPLPLLHPWGPSYFTHLVNGWKEARRRCASLVPKRILALKCLALKCTPRKRNVWAAEQIFKPPTAAYVWRNFRNPRPIRHARCERADTRLTSAKHIGFCHRHDYFGAFDRIVCLAGGKNFQFCFPLIVIFFAMLRFIIE